MARSEVIGNRQLAEILFMMRTTVVLSFVPAITTGAARQDAWAAALFSGMMLTGIAWAISTLGSAYPHLTVVEYSRRLLGTLVGTAVSLVFAYLYLLVAATDTRVFSELVKTAFMTRTPIVVVMSATIATFTLIALLGIEVVARVADMFIPLFVAFVVLTLIGAVGHFRLQNLQPVLASGIRPVISSSWTIMGIGAQWAVISMLVPSLTEPERVASSTVVTAVLASLVSAVTAAAVVGVLGDELARESLFPFLKMARSIQISPVLQRIESLGVSAWGFGLAVTGSTMVYCGSRALTQILGIKDYRWVVPFFGVAVGFYARLAYRDVSAVIEFFRPPRFPIFIAALVGVPYLLLWGAHLVARARAGATRR